MLPLHYSYAFFNKKGTQYNFVMKDGIITGSIFMPESSVGLIENETMYILSRYWNTTIFDTVYGTPRGAKNLLMKFARKDNVFKFFSIDQSGKDSFITGTDEVILPIDEGSGVITNDRYILSPTDVQDKAVKLNFLTRSENEGVFDNELLIYLFDDDGSKTLVGRINVVSTISGLDDRFKTILSNFGESLDDDTFKIFKEADINDIFTDTRGMNARMKELILEFGNIFPNTGVLKGLSNILKFFGYDDMRIKEYWLNTESGKFLKREIAMGDNMDKKITILRKPYKKMPYFGLYYDLNRHTGEFDDEGLPEMEDDNFFTKDEITIKLFGLKRYIEDRNIGGISKIIDIIGEANYFGKISYYHSLASSEIISDIKPQTEVKVDINSKSGYLVDIRDYLFKRNRPVCLLPANFVMSGIEGQMYQHYSCISGFFNDYNIKEEDIFKEENYDIPIGFVLKLENKTFDIPLGDIDTTFKSLDSFDIDATFENFTNLSFYKLKWEVERVATDSRKFYYEYTGNINESSRYLECILPYDGKYRIKLTLYGYGNNNIYYSYDYIEVKLQNIECVGYFQEYEDSMNVIGEIEATLEDFDYSMKGPIYRKGNVPARVEDRSFNIANFIDLNQYGDVNIGVRTDYPLDKIDASFENMGHIRIADFGYERERMPDVNVQKISPGGLICIDGVDINVPDTININDFGVFEALLQAAFPSYFITLRENEERAIKFIDIRKDEDDMWAASTNTDIDCIEDTFGNLNSIDVPIGEIPVTFHSANRICHVKEKVNPFNRNNVQLSADTLTVHQYTCVFFADDISPNLGRKNQKWSVYYEEDGDYLAKDIVCRYFNYRFEFPGFYTITLELQDTNGNSYKIVKKNFVEVII